MEAQEQIAEQVEAVTKLIDALVEFAVTYGFQIFGTLFVLFLGLKAANWAGRKTAVLAERKALDVTLARFIGNMVKLVLVGFVIIITLGNFGITITPLIALAGASAFGATLAIQGPLSNYGAGLSIILSHPFVVGDTISVRGVSGMVEEVRLALTVLVGEDGEQIFIPNKEIVGEVLVNSQAHRVVQTKIAISAGADVEKAISTVADALAKFPGMGAGPPPQIGIHDFTYGGVVIGVRFWVPSRKYFKARYGVNGAILSALREAGVSLLDVAALTADSLSADDDKTTSGS